MKFVTVKRIFIAVLVIFIITGSAFALSDAEYKQMIKNSEFARADKALNDAWSEAKNSLSANDFEALKNNQREWISKGRDNEAKELMNRLSKIEAYTAVTYSRAEYITQLSQKSNKPTGDYVELNPKVFKTEDDREAQATENAYTFEQKIIELANQISSSNQHNYQDMELVEGNTMVADEIVYMRAWQGKGYFFIRNYENKSWSNNNLTHFYINDKSSVNFTGRVKIGCTIDDLTAVFGDKLE